MRFHLICAAFVLGTTRLAAGQGAPPATSVAQAQQALTDALARHDRAAFERLLAPDATFLLPVATHGLDNVVRAWLPVLSDGRLTLTLTATEPVVANSGDVAYVTGSFSYRGPAGLVTAPAQEGEFVAVWHALDGQWKVAAFSGGAMPRSRPLGGVGSYRFGMTLDDVRHVPDCEPYTNVPQTGGLECRNYSFDGRSMNISFLFASGRLRRLQLWFYEGGSEANAKDAVTRVLDFLTRTTGGVSTRALAAGEITSDRIMDVLSAAHPTPTSPFQVDLTTPAGSQLEVWFARVAKVQTPAGQTGYFVLLFADPRQ